MSFRYLLEESLFIREVNGAKPESANGEAESPGTGVFSRYLLEESLFIGEVGGAKPQSADDKAESRRTGECSHATYLKNPCLLERWVEPNQSLQMARLNPPGQESVFPLLT